MANLDLQIMGGGGHPDPEIRGGGSLKIFFFWALRASFWSKNKGGGLPGPLPGIRHCFPFSAPMDPLYRHIGQITSIQKQKTILLKFSLFVCQNQSQCTFPRFVIGLVLPLLLASPTTHFPLDRNDGVASGIRRLFSLDRKVRRF